MATTMLRRRGRVRRALTALAPVALIPLLAACSGGGNSGAASGSPHGTLHLLVSSADGSDAGFRAVDAAFEKAYPNIKVDFSTVPNANYPAAEASRLTAGNVDVLVLNSLFEAPSYAKGSESNDARLADSGQFVDLTKQPFMKEVSSSVRAAQEYKGKDYTFPTGLSYYTGVFYNKTMFQQQGLSIPTTWDEFTADCKKLQAAGITPVGIGGKDGWPAGLSMLAAVESAYPTAADRQKLAKDLWTQKVKLSDPSQVAILNKTEQFYSYAQKDFAGVSDENMPADFAKGQFAMFSEGTWDQTTVASAVGSKFDFGYFPIPMSNTAADNADLGGKVELKLAVASSAPNKSAALAYVKFFSEKKNYETFLDHAGFAPSVQGVKTNPFLESITKYTSTFQPAWDVTWTANNDAGKAALYPYNYPALKPLGTSTPAQAAKAAQDAWSTGN